MQHVTAEGTTLVQQAEEAASNKVNIIFLLSTTIMILLIRIIFSYGVKWLSLWSKVAITYIPVDNFCAL